MYVLDLENDDYSGAYLTLRREVERCKRRVEDDLASLPEDEAVNFTVSAMVAILSEDDNGGLLHDKLCACYLESAQADIACAAAAYAASRVAPSGLDDRNKIDVREAMAEAAEEAVASLPGVTDLKIAMVGSSCDIDVKVGASAATVTIYPEDKDNLAYIRVPEVGDAHAAAAKAVSAISELDDAMTAMRAAQERAGRMVGALGTGSYIDEVLADIENVF